MKGEKQGKLILKGLLIVEYDHLVVHDGTHVIRMHSRCYESTKFIT